MSESKQMVRPKRAVTLPEFSIGRKRIRVGTAIRTRISCSSGPVYRRSHPQGESGVFLVREIWSVTVGRSTRVYVEADGAATARAVTLYISGRKYKSPAPSTWMYPYMFSVKRPNATTKKARGKRRGKVATVAVGAAAVQSTGGIVDAAGG